MKLMIVDDHAGIRRMIRQFTASSGDAVCECASGSEAVLKAREFTPDWVTMDIMMPGQDGFAATRSLVASVPAVRVIIVSTHDQPELRQLARNAGAVAFVAKDNLRDLKGHPVFADHRPAGKPAAPNQGAQ